MTKLRYYNTPEAPPFSRRWWMGASRSLLWVALVTVLIWVYADIEFTDVREFHLTVRLHTAMPKNMVLRDRRDVEVAVKVRGNWTELARFRDWLDVNGSVIRYDPSDTHGLGKRPISTIEVFDKFPVHVTGGVTIVSCMPSQIDIDLIPADQRPLRVEFVYTGAIVDPNFRIVPDRVTARASQEQWKRIEALLEANAPVLKTSIVDLSRVATDRPLSVEVIPAIAGVPVEVHPGSVEVTVRNVQKIETKSFQVAIHVLTPPTWPNDGTWKDYSLLGRDGTVEWQKTVQVSGPKKDIDQLTPARIQAYVVLTDDDKKPISSWSNREVLLRFPDNLQVALTGTKPTVYFRLEKRGPAPTPP
jgi:hypothetical protein